jgi:single-strand DNA-binding protein
MLIGRLGQDPDISTPGQNKLAKFSMATTHRFKQGTEWVDKTEWHRLVAWGKLAEVVEKFVRKGSLIYIEGRLQTTKYDKDGVTHYATDIVVGSLQMLSKKAGDTGGGQASGEPDPDFNPDDDIPF